MGASVPSKSKPSSGLRCISERKARVPEGDRSGCILVMPPPRARHHIEQ
jgi:hypothetical protein